MMVNNMTSVFHYSFLSDPRILGERVSDVEQTEKLLKANL